MSTVAGIHISRLLLNIVFFVLRSFFTFANSAYPDEKPHDGISKHGPKIYFTIGMHPNIFFFLKKKMMIFLVPYAFTGCNLRVGKFKQFLRPI